MNRKRLAGAVLMSLVITLPVDQPRAQGPDVDLPVFEVEPSWPMLPNDWVLGQVASVTVDRQRPGVGAAPAAHGAGRGAGRCRTAGVGL